MGCTRVALHCIKVPNKIPKLPSFFFQLVHIERKADNLLPFAESSLTRKLTAGYIHSRYAGLLIAPVHLSGECCVHHLRMLQELVELLNGACCPLQCSGVVVCLH